jgi:hypothetical protein
MERGVQRDIPGRILARLDFLARFAVHTVALSTYPGVRGFQLVGRGTSIHIDAARKDPGKVLPAIPTPDARLTR